MKYQYPFNLARAKAGAEFGTANGSRCELVAHMPQRREHLRVTIRDITQDRCYSHFEDGRHHNSTERTLFMKDAPPLKTNQTVAEQVINEIVDDRLQTQSLINSSLERRISELERKLVVAPTKQIR